MPPTTSIAFVIFIVAASAAPSLLDLESNPDELHNLVGDPAHRETIRRLGAALLFQRGAKLRGRLGAAGDGGAVTEFVLDSDGEEVQSTPVPAQNPMLPPLRFTLENYKQNVRRGRRRTRRFRRPNSLMRSKPLMFWFQL